MLIHYLVSISPGILEKETSIYALMMEIDKILLLVIKYTLDRLLLTRPGGRYIVILLLVTDCDLDGRVEVLCKSHGEGNSGS